MLGSDDQTFDPVGGICSWIMIVFCFMSDSQGEIGGKKYNKYCSGSHLGIMTPSEVARDSDWCCGKFILTLSNVKVLNLQARPVY